MRKAGFVIPLLGLFFISFVSASSLPYQVAYVVQDGIYTAQEFFRPILEALIGGYSSPEFLFVKTLLLLLVFIMARYGLENMPKLGENKPLVNIVAAVVAILAVRYIQDNDLINGILLPYGVLGIALTAILPFMIYFFFVENSIKHTSGRRLAWIFYLIVFGVLWAARVDELSPIGNQIYLWTFVAGCLALIFDKGIQWYFGYNEDVKERRQRFISQISLIDTRLSYLYGAPNQTEAMKEEIKDLEKRRKSLKKNM